MNLYEYVFKMWELRGLQYSSLQEKIITWNSIDLESKKAWFINHVRWAVKGCPEITADNTFQMPWNDTSIDVTTDHLSEENLCINEHMASYMKLGVKPKTVRVLND